METVTITQGTPAVPAVTATRATIKEFFDAYPINHSAFARKYGISITYLHNVVHGKNKMTPKVVNAVNKFLKEIKIVEIKN